MYGLGSQYDSTASLLNLFFGSLGEKSGLNDDRARRKITLTEDLEDSVTGDINNRGLIASVSSAGLLGDKRPQLINIYGGFVELVLLVVNVTLTDLTEVSWMAKRQNISTCGTQKGFCYEKGQRMQGQCLYIGRRGLRYVLLVEEDSVMLETTSMTTSARMLSVLS